MKKSIAAILLIGTLLFLFSACKKKPLRPYEFALLSADVYDDEQVITLPEHLVPFLDFDTESYKSGISFDGALMKEMADKKEWGKLVPYLALKLIAKDGYFGRAYINKTNKEIIIAHRGTDLDYETKENGDGGFSLTIKQNISEILNDLDDDIDILHGRVPHQQLRAAEHFEAAVKKAFQEQYGYLPKISHTGHSLGAVLAELCAVQDTIKAVTFESPGTYPMVLDLLGKEKIDGKSFDITIYNAAPNAINMANQQMGTVTNLFQQKGEKMITDKKSEAAIKAVFEQHSILELIKQFDPKTGYPIKMPSK